MALAKATFQALGAGQDAAPQGEPIPVQFNPTSLRLAVENRLEGNNSRGKQQRQYIGASSTKLSMELVFDTADEGTTETARSVREKTSNVVKFLLPQEGAGQKPPPPRLRFQWGSFIFEGIMERVNEEVDLFAEDGTPLRAKLTVEISEQKLQYQFEAPEQLAGEAGSPPAAGKASGNGPGSSGGGKTNRSAAALDGESLPNFLARNGLDPSAWRAVADQVGGALSLSAGVSLEFDGSLQAQVGLGAQIGVQAGIGASVESKLGLGSGGGSRESDGFALAAAGGLGAAVQKAQQAKAATAVAETKAAFGASTSSSTASATRVSLRPQSTRPSLVNGDRPQREAEAEGGAPLPPVADPRETSYGAGVPLRPRQATRGRECFPVLGGVGIRARKGAGEVPTTTDPTVPSWVALPEE